MNGLLSDDSARLASRIPPESETALRRIAEAISVGTGARLFESVAHALHGTLGTAVALVARVDATGNAETAALVIDGQLVPNEQSMFDGTPCADILKRQICHHLDGVADLFPEYDFLRHRRIRSVLGMPVIDGQGAVIGLVAVLDREPLADPQFAADALRIFALRVGTELERELSAEALRRSEELYRTVLTSSVEGICGMTLDGELTFVNLAAATMLGWESAELVGRNFFRDVAPPMAETERLGGGGGIAGETLFRRREGTSFPVEYVVSPMREGGLPTGWVVSFLEVTQRRKLEAQLEQATRVNALGQLAASVAHEFNNVMMGIQPFAEIVGRQAGGNASLESASVHIANALRRGKRITDEILRFARPVPLSFARVEIAGLLARIRGELRQALPEGIDLRIDIEGEEALTIEGDPMQLEQVLVNLASNAADAMEGSGTFEIRARHGASHNETLLSQMDTPDAWVHLTIRDTGCGIAAADLPHIFEPLFTTKKAGKGTGLGLAITQRVINEHYGRVFVESEVGRGTMFHVLLPSVGGRRG